MKIRPAIPDDVVGIVEIERSSPTAAHWSEELYHRAMSGVSGLPERILLVAVADSVSQTDTVKIPVLPSQKVRRQERGIPVGFLVAQHVSGEWELENIVVAPEFRGRGIGQQLLLALLVHVRETESRRVFLEVRESNTAARKFYRKAGFREIGRRKGYYAKPAEDAVLYCLDTE